MMAARSLSRRDERLAVCNQGTGREQVTVLKPLHWTMMAAATTSLALGCGSRQATLEPAPAANTVDDDKVVSSAKDVQVVATTSAWEGNSDIRDHVTPMKVKITNRSDKPVRLDYSRFHLHDRGGNSFAALPLYAIDGDVDTPVASYADGVVEPDFFHQGFWVSPYYATTYPSVPAYSALDARYPYNGGYYERYYPYWGTLQVPMPTREMVRKALPEGVLDAGGTVEGYLYFEKIPADIDEVQFRAQLVDARTDEVFGNIDIPFLVKS